MRASLLGGLQAGFSVSRAKVGCGRGEEDYSKMENVTCRSLTSSKQQTG